MFNNPRACHPFRYFAIAHHMGHEYTAHTEGDETSCAIYCDGDFQGMAYDPEPWRAIDQFLAEMGRQDVESYDDFIWRISNESDFSDIDA